MQALRLFCRSTFGLKVHRLVDRASRSLKPTLTSRPSIVRMLSNKSVTKEEAMAKLRSFVQPGQGMKETTVIYNEEGKNYDNTVVTLNYSAHTKLAEVVKNLLGDKTDVKILDIGAGTGLSGQELYNQGFTNIDAVDGSEGMLAVAKQKNVYGQLVCHFVGEDPMPFPDNSYDIVTTAGAISENHIPASGLSDMVRVVKPGGYVVNVFRKLALSTSYYKNNLKGPIKQLEDNAVWTLVKEGTFPNMIADVEGYYMVHRVL